MSVHVSSLPSSAAWETPLNVSLDVIEAISDAADQAADAAGQLLHRRRSRSWQSKWTVLALALAIAVVVAAARRRSRDDDESPARSTTPD